MGMEYDPADHKVTFVEVIDGPEVNNLRDACVVIAGLHKAALMLHEQYGYVCYPVYKVGDEGTS